MFGICTSAIKQWVALIIDDCKYDSAEGNVQAENPSDLTSFSTAVRNRSSSSTIDMSGISATCSFHQRQRKRLPDAEHAQSAMEQGPRKYYLGASFLDFLSSNTEIFGNKHQIGQRFRAHLSHYVAAMDLHSHFTYAHLVGYLLVHQASGHQRHDLAFTWCQ